MSAGNVTPSSGNPSPATGTAEPFDLTGKTLGEFQILRRIGKGGMAEVYLADQTTLQRQVAIKVLRPEFLADATYVKRFRHEATAAGGLNHPNIVQVYSIGEQDGLQYIAQEYVRGGNLREFMRRKGTLEVPLVLHILRQVAAALQVACNSGIVHRDIKPENILLTKKGEAKVADFGLAQLTQQGERVELTQVGVTMGTPLYMSPEQVGGKGVDHRSDQYSFGAMAYHMLAGKPPFTGENALAIAVQHLNNQPKPLLEWRPDVPQAVCNLIHKMMEKDRDDRFADPQALLTELKLLQKQFVGKDGTMSQSVPSMKAVSARRRISLTLDRPLRRQLGRMALFAVMIALAAAGVGWAMRTGDPFAKEALPDPAVPHEPSIAAQYFHAMRSGDDELAWKAVVDYPPDPTGRPEMDRQSAELRLAIIYLKHGQRDKAAEIFQRFKHDGVANPWKLDHGLAGEAIIASLRGEHAASKSSIDQLDRQNGKLDARLSLLVDEARVRNAAALNKTP